jgi:quercetin dioxygenase-like cupin family protein
MNEEVRWLLARVDQRTFTGVAYSGLIAGADAAVSAKVYFVRFQADARTFWHSHGGVQILVVTSGRCRYQRSGHPVAELGPGESVRFEAGERHWHGAAGPIPTEHLAINLTTEPTVWMEEVSEIDFRATDSEK